MVNEAKRHDQDTKATHQKTSVNHGSRISSDLVGDRIDRIVLYTASGSAAESSEVQKSATKWIKE